MPQPTASDAHVDVPLTNLSIAWWQKDPPFCDRVFPTVPVEKQSDKYYEFTKDDLLRDEMRAVADGAATDGSGFNLSTSTYYCDVYGLHKKVTDRQRKNADSVINLDRSAMEFVMTKAKIRRCRQFATDFLKTGLWGTDRQGVASGETGNQFRQWSDYANSNPEQDIETAKQAITKRCGSSYKPNTMVVSSDVHAKLRHHPNVKEQFKYTSAESITEEMLARFFSMERYIVAEDIYATNAEGATAAYDWISSKKVLLCHSAPSPGIEIPSAGYTFTWNLYNSAQNGLAIKRIRDEKRETDMVEGKMSFDHVATGTDLGEYFYDAIA